MPYLKPYLGESLLLKKKSKNMLSRLGFCAVLSARLFQIYSVLKVRYNGCETIAL